MSKLSQDKYERRGQIKLLLEQKTTAFEHHQREYLKSQEQISELQEELRTNISPPWTFSEWLFFWTFFCYCFFTMIKLSIQ